MSDYSDFVVDWLAFVSRTKSVNTHYTYGHLIKEFERFVGHKPWHTVSRDDVHAFLYRPRPKTRSGTAAKDSTARDISIIRSFFNWLAGEQLLSRDHLPIYNLERPKGAPTIEREPVKEWVWQAVWNSGVPTMDERLWLGLGYFCGLRRAEMAMLPAVSVSPRSDRRGSGSLRALRKGGGMQSGISYAKICHVLSGPDGVPDLATRTDEWMDLLESTAKFRHDMPCLLASADPSNVTNSVHTIWRHCKQLQDRVGIPRAQQFSPHNMRHSAATNLALSNVPKAIIRQQLNHSTEAMTEHYINAAMLFDRWVERGSDDWAS